jgi:hypothetical protein
MMFIKPAAKPKPQFWFRFRKTKVPPCRLCAFAVPIIGVGASNVGRQCIWYGIRLPASELEEPTSEVRQHCLRDGNNFSWSILGFTTEKLLEMRMKMTDWHLQRSATAVQRHAAIISLVLSGIAIAVSVMSLFLKSGN